MIRDKNVLFVCMWGQSRSKYFAEQYSKINSNTKYCGYLQEKSLRHHIDWADVIVVLDKDWFRQIYSKIQLDLERLENIDKRKINHYIIDEPRNFKSYYSDFLEMLEVEDIK